MVCPPQDEICVHSVMDGWALDFLTNRLPPFPRSKSKFALPDPATADTTKAVLRRSLLLSTSGRPLSTMNSFESPVTFRFPIRLRQAHLLRVSSSGTQLLLHHPFNNSRRFHMGSPDDEPQDTSTDSEDGDESRDAEDMDDFAPADSVDMQSANASTSSKTTASSSATMTTATTASSTATAVVTDDDSNVDGGDDDHDEDEDIPYTLVDSDEEDEDESAAATSNLNGVVVLPGEVGS